MEKYIPSHLEIMQGINVPSAWIGLESILPAIITDFKIKKNAALEFGCEFGYSTSILAQIFHKVTAVDTFEGDIHCGIRESFYENTLENLKEYKNIDLIKQNALLYINMNYARKWDLIHIDIVHTYLPTYTLGNWSIKHSDCVIFHDYVSFPEVKKAVDDLCEIEGVYGEYYESYNGLAIIHKEKK